MSIKIIYDVKYKILFLFLAEFFRFIGFDVGEETLEEYLSEGSNTDFHECFDVCIFIGVYPEQEEKELQAGIIDLLINPQIAGINPQPSALMNLTKLMKIKLLDQVLAIIGAVLGVPLNIPPNTIQTLEKIYVKQELYLHSANLLFYANKPSFAMADAQEPFITAYYELEKMKENMGGSNYCLDYASVWCASNVNYARKYQGEMLYFEEEALIRKCRHVIKKYPDFAPAKTLLGNCYDAFWERPTDTVLAYQSALKEENARCNSADIYYKIGKKIETLGTDKEKARDYYRMSYERKRNIRNLFKMGVYAMSDDALDAAEGYYGEIIAILNAGLEADNLTPLEIEYAYKAYYQICFIYYGFIDKKIVNWQNKNISQQVILYGTKAIKIWEEKLGQDDYYNDLYKEDAEKYRTLSKERMLPDGVYRMVSRAYAEQQNAELSAEYWNKVKQS